MFFTAVNPMDTRPDQREVEYDLDKPRITPYKHTWRSHHNTVFWCDLNLAHRNELRCYQTRSHAITLSDTLPAICIDKVVCLKTTEELCCKTHRSPRLPRVFFIRRMYLFQNGENPMTVRMKFISTGRLVAVIIALISNPWHSKLRC